MNGGIGEWDIYNTGESHMGNVILRDGPTYFGGTTTMGDASSTMTVNSGGALGISTTGTNILNKVLTLSTGRMTNSVGSNTITGNVSLFGANQIDVNTGSTLVLAVPWSASVRAKQMLLVLSKEADSPQTNLIVIDDIQEIS